MSRILLIDSDVNLLISLKLLLTSHKFEVETLADCNHSLDEVVTWEPDLIISEVKLENTDGRDLCFSIKTNENTKHIPVILYTRLPVEDSELVDYRADHFISKPFKTGELLKAINQYLS
jgi:two-component system phosphate regulon response regulator PhoB